MGKVAFIGGSSLFKSKALEGKSETVYHTAVGDCLAFVNEQSCYIQRHGKENVAPHQINHQANFTAVKDMGYDSVIALNSVGSLKKDIAPGEICLAEDFLSFYNIPTVERKERNHVTPVLSEDLSAAIEQCLDTHMKRVVYWQTTGPRFETPAEIRLMAQFADVVGMTMGSEATIAAELGIRYTSVCIVDNFCNGIKDTPLSYEEFEKLVAENQAKVDELIGRLSRCHY